MTRDYEGKIDPGGQAICQMSAAEIADAVNTGRLSSMESVCASLDAIASHAYLNAVITSCPERAMARAQSGVSGPLAGVPVIVKDMFDTSGVRTTYGSSIFASHVPRRTAEAVVQLERAGAIVVGKANQHEFAWGVTSQNPHWGDVQNPVRPGKVAGGSSGGNAAALAACLCALGLGGDTGGSIRIPSACCGTVGFKPPYGRVSVKGTFPLAPTFDTAGPMARTVADCILAYSALTGAAAPLPRMDGLTIGMLVPTPEAAALETLGAHVVEMALPTPEADPTPMFMVECAISHRHLYPARRAEYGPDARVKWDSAREVTAIAYYEAQIALRKWRKTVRGGLRVDLVISPTLGIDVPGADCWEPDVRGGMARHTRQFNFLGWPAVALGNLQVAGPDDQKVLAAALAWEQAFGAPSPAP